MARRARTTARAAPGRTRRARPHAHVAARARSNTVMSHAPSPDGPWSDPVVVFPDYVGGDTNFAPIIRADGSVVALWRRWEGSRGSRVYLASASDWANVSTYEMHDTAELWPDLGPMGTEDPFLWPHTDGRGVHAIFHHMYGLPAPLNQRQWWLEAAGAHAYSPDGLTRWTFGGLAYGNLSTPGNTVHYTDGSTRTFARRERPHMVVDKRGRVTHITNAVDIGDGLCASPGCAHYGDGCFTFVQPVRTA